MGKSYDLGKVVAHMQLETRSFLSDLDDVTRRFDRFLEVGMRVGSGLTQAFSSWLQVGIETNSMLDANTRSFANLTKSQEKAVEFMGQLQDFAVSTPFETEGLADTSRVLTAMGVQLDNTIPLLQIFGDAAAMAGGNGSEKVKLIANAFTQVIAAGKLGGQEMIQFVNNGVSMVPLLSKAYGKTSGEIRKMMENGELDAKTSMSAVLRYMVENSSGAMTQLNNTFGGRWSSIMEQFKMSSAAATKPLYDKLTALLPVAAAFGNAILRATVVLVPAVLMLADGIGALMVGFLSLSDSTQNWIVYGTAIAAVVTMAAVAFGVLVFAIASVFAAYTTFIAFIGTTGGIVIAVLGGIASLFLGLAIVIADVAIAAFGVWHSEWFQKTIVAVSEMVDSIIAAFVRMQVRYAGVLNVISTVSRKFFADLITAWHDTLTPFYNLMAGGLTMLETASRGAFEGMTKFAINFATAAVKAIFAFTSGGTRMLSNLISHTTNTMGKLAEMMPEGKLRDAAMATAAAYKGAAAEYAALVTEHEAFGDTVVSTVESMGSAIKDFLPTIPKVSDIVNAISSGDPKAEISQAFNDIGSVYVKAIEGYLPKDIAKTAEEIIKKFSENSTLPPVDVEKLINDLFKDFVVPPPKDAGAFGFDKEINDWLKKTDDGLVSHFEALDAIFKADNIAGQVDWIIWNRATGDALTLVADSASNALGTMADVIESSIITAAKEYEKRLEALAGFNKSMMNKLDPDNIFGDAKQFQIASKTGLGIPGAIGNVVGASAMAGPIGILIGAIVSLVTKTEAFASFVSSIETVISNIISTIDSLLQAVKPFTAMVNKMTTGIFDMIKPIFDAVGKMFNGLGATMAPFIVVLQSLTSIFQNAGLTMGPIAQLLNGVFFSLFLIFKAIGITIIGFQLALATIWNAIVDAIAGFADKLGLHKLADSIRTARSGTRNLEDKLNELYEMSWDDAQAMAENASATTEATSAIQQMTAELLNVPAGYKVALERFNAMAADVLLGNDVNTNNAVRPEENNNNNNNGDYSPPKKNQTRNETQTRDGGTTARTSGPSANKAIPQNNVEGSGSGGGATIIIENLTVMANDPMALLAELERLTVRKTFLSTGAALPIAANKFRGR